MIEALPDVLVEPLVRAALAEDLGRGGDLTSIACIEAGTQLAARFVSRRPGVAAGIACARLSILALDPEAEIAIRKGDGDALGGGDVIAEVRGDARSLLAAERTALNFLGRLCGVATLARAFVDEVAGTGAAIADTRKTTPLLRALEKHAVRCGGARNHRFGLDDAVLIKDNHVAAAGGVGAAIRRAKATVGHLVRIEAEIDSLGQLDEALAEGPDVVMLDNFSLADLRAAVSRAHGKVVLEASGGVSLATVRAIAETGVDVISVGALTHSAPVLDIGLDAV